MIPGVHGLTTFPDMHGHGRNAGGRAEVKVPARVKVVETFILT